MKLRTLLAIGRLRPHVRLPLSDRFHRGRFRPGSWSRPPVRLPSWQLPQPLGRLTALTRRPALRDPIGLLAATPFGRFVIGLDMDSLRQLRPLLKLGLIAGVIVGVVTYPLAAIGGLAVKAGSDLIDGLPAQLLVVPPAQTSYLYANDGKTLITQFYEEYRKYTPLAEMSPYIQQAIISSEDTRFFEHHGVDPRGIARAFVANNQSGAVAQGASTLTMQYVRMALRDSAETPEQVQAAVEQTHQRKLREMRMAVELEKHMSKLEILEHYLNVSYFGHRAYGIYAAAEVYFSKRPADLNLAEAAMLAGLVQAPSSYDPASTDPQAATDRRNWVIDRMVALKYVSVEAARAAQGKPIGLRLTEPANDCVSVPGDHNNWGFFCNQFKSWWIAQPAFGSSPEERLDKLRRGGYRIVSSLDPKIQSSAEKHILEKEPANSPYALGTVAIEPGSGLIKAMAVNRVYALDQSHNGPHTDAARRGVVPSNYPNTVNPLLGGPGDVNGYQAGSTFKMFTMLAALERGIPLNTKINSPQRYTSQYISGRGEPASCGERWCPSNANAAMTGVQTVWSGFGKSVNTFFVQLEQLVGAENAVRMAERLGLNWHTSIDKLQASPAKANGWGAFTLGVADTTPMEMANAYATVAAEGMYCEPMPAVAVIGLDGEHARYRDASGSVRDVASPRCHRVVAAEVARGALDAARCVTGYKAAKGDCGDWSTGPSVYPTVKRPVAGKTGTTDNNRAAWFLGMTPALTAAGFMADPDNPFNVVGGSNSLKPIAVVAEMLRDALKDTPVRDFTPPSTKIVTGK